MRFTISRNFCLLILSLFCCEAAFAENKISNTVTPEDFGCVSNDKHSASNNAKCLQKAVDFCVANGCKLTSNANCKYYIDKGIRISGFINIDFGCATLAAVDTIKVLNIHWDKTEYWTGNIKNFRIDLNNIGKVGINCDKVIKLCISDGEIIGIGANAIGLNIEKGYELLAKNLHFHGSQVNSTGIKINTSDCHFSDCIMIDCYTAVDNTGSNFYERIHAWMLPNYLKGSTYFRNRKGLVFLNQCFSDTYDKTFVVDNVCEMHISQFKLFHNKIMWENLPEAAPILFLFRNEKTASESRITLSNSHVGGLIIEHKNRQKISNIVNHQIDMRGSFVQE